MSGLIKKVKGEVLTNLTTSVKFIKNITAEAQLEDYINLNQFVAYLQNYTKVDKEIEDLEKPLNYGLPMKDNTEMVTIEITY
jgi:hypothetical protein